MLTINRILSIGALSLALCAAASAQTRNSFFDVDAINGMTVTPSNGGLTYQINVGPNPELVYNSVTYTITDIFAFYALSDDNDLTSSAATQNGWSVDTSNSGPGGIAGWNTNPNTGITPSGSLTFNFTSLDVPSVERVGFHMRFAQNFANTGGNTAFVTGPFNPVPEPASIAALGIGAVTLIRRRKTKSS